MQAGFSLHGSHIFFQFRCRQSAVRCSCHHLPQGFDAHITRCINAFRAGLLGGIGYDISLLIQLNNPFYCFRSRGISCKHKDAKGFVTLIFRHLSGGGIFIPGIGQPVFSGYFLHHGIGQHGDLLMILRLIRHGGGAGKVIFPNQHRHMPGKFRQKYTFLRCCVTATHHKDLFIRKKFSIAGSAVGNAPALVFFLPLEANISRMGTGGQKDPKTPEISVTGMHGLDITGKIKAGHFCQLKFRAKTLRLLHYGICQRFTGSFCNTGVVDHFMGNGDLAAKSFLLQNQTAVLGPGKIECGGEPRRAAADNDNIIQIIHQSCPTRSRLGFRVSAPGFQLAGQT